MIKATAYIFHSLFLYTFMLFMPIKFEKVNYLELASQSTGVSRFYGFYGDVIRELKGLFLQCLTFFFLYLLGSSLQLTTCRQVSAKTLACIDVMDFPGKLQVEIPVITKINL